MDYETQIIELFSEKDYEITKTVSDKYALIKLCPVCGQKNHFVIDLKNNIYFSSKNCCKGGGLYEFLQEVLGYGEDFF